MQAIRHSSGSAKESLQQGTRALFRKVKREYYNDICKRATLDNIWKLAKWGTGARTVPIPPLKDGDTLAATPESRAALFHCTFFPPVPPLPPRHQRRAWKQQWAWGWRRRLDYVDGHRSDPAVTSIFYYCYLEGSTISHHGSTRSSPVPTFFSIFRPEKMGTYLVLIIFA